MELAQILVLLLIILSIILMGLIIAYVVIVIKSKQQNKNHKNVQANKETISKDIPIATNDKESIYNFMEFDEIKDNMIIRKNRKQYVMVEKCKGVNYDLMSEEEKVSVESGFVQFLNTLRFPIQLYIQTTSLNLRDTIEEYKNRLRHMEKEIRDIDSQLEMAKARGNSEAINKLILAFISFNSSCIVSLIAREQDKIVIVINNIKHITLIDITVVFILLFNCLKINIFVSFK